MGLDPGPLGANFLLYSFEEKYISSLIPSNKVKARHSHSKKYFIDKFCSINDGGGFRELFSEIYPTELELKLEHQDNHATFFLYHQEGNICL